MNKKLGLIGSIINAITVLLFAIFMAIDFNFASYFVCILLSLSFVMMIAAFENECTEDKKDKALKYLLLIHGIFFLSCLIMPMTGVFAKSSGSSSHGGGVIAPEIWCLYFLPIGVLSGLHFKN